MRTIKIIFVTILILGIVLFTGVLLFLKTVDFNLFKKEITEGISQAIGRDVSMKHVSFDFSLVNGITLHMSGLSIMDHPSFSKDPMLYVDTSHLSVDTLPFLIKRQILVSEIELDSPKIILIRNNKGKTNFQKLVLKGKSGSPIKGPGALSFAGDVVEGAVKDSSKGYSVGELLIRSIHIKDGTIIFSDYTANPSIMIPLREINFRISNLSLDAPFPFEGKASLFSARKNIHFSGLAQVDTQNNQVRLDDLKIPFDLSSLLMESVYEGIPPMRGVGLMGGINGQLAININQMILGSNGLLVLSADGDVTGVNMLFRNSPLPVEDLNVSFSATESDVDLQKMTMPLASGTMNVKGRLVDYLSERKFSADLRLDGIELNELGQEFKLPVSLEGQLSGSYKFNGTATEQKILQSSLIGEGVFEVENGRIKDVNLLRLALSKISFIPNLASEIESTLPERYKEKLKAKDTILEKVQLNAKISEGIMFIDRAEISADGFFLLAYGKMDFKQNIGLAADLYVPSDLSSRMVLVSEELKYFLDDSKRIHIPFKPYFGPLSQLRMYPDVEDLGKEILRNRGKEELRKVLFKALDLDGDDSQESPPEGADPQTQPSSGSQEKPAEESSPSPEEAIIEDIFDMIPIFK